MSKLLKHLKDNGLNDKTAKQYYLQVNKFLKVNNIATPDRFNSKNDKEILDMAYAYCNQAKKVYIRKYAMIKLFQYLDRNDLEIKFREKVKTKLKLLDSSKGDRALSIDELKKVIDELPYRYGLMVKIMFWGAYRSNEVLKLRKENLKEIRGKIRITVIGKNKKKLVSFIPTDISKEIITYTNKVCGKDRKRLLFDMTYEHFDYMLRKVSKEAIGIQATSHDLGKKTRAHWELIENKTPLNRIQKILHHSDISTSLRYLSDAGVDSEAMIEEREGLISL